MAKKTFIGKVVSDKMTNTVVVAIETKVPHARYGKLLKHTKRLKAGTDGTVYAVGDLVLIEETKPMSKDKNFRVVGKESKK